MTNGEKFKTAKERTKKFSKFCDTYYENNGGCQECVLSPYKLCDCKFAWLDLEAEEEGKPLPCPFCGCDCEIKVDDSYKPYWVYCHACGYNAISDITKSGAIAAHNRVASAVERK